MLKMPLNTEPFNLGSLKCLLALLPSSMQAQSSQKETSSPTYGTLLNKAITSQPSMMPSIPCPTPLRTLLTTKNSRKA
uniref:Predicted protein n=1 Tax=Hordeum vulgare subsp. vulgare TaxID=112509 RepID=F2DZF7_HORVV|nr:predicted protein [Hordeum vulgare subsp. vulgare]